MSMSCDVCEDLQEVDAIVDRWGRNPEFAIEMMQDVQDRFRYLPRAGLERMSELTGTDMGRLYHIATFFKAFSLKPRGEIEVQVCTGTACHVRGAARVLDAFGRELDVKPGETTGDLKFSLSGVRCLGCCSLAPVVTMGADLLGDVDSSKVRRLVEKYRRTAGTPGKEGADA
ncbi:MAG: NAD(P)H-dependent oxidoreductase subunit E [Deltaproteobacteria bacterium]|nr:NAD(P)H-dependent oxidoreductase subunit E [Deltaproteobacteria bacterium]